jgi:hypothetical protein
MEDRMKLYKKECKEAGRELMVSGVKLRTPNGKLWMNVGGKTTIFNFLLVSSSRARENVSMAEEALRTAHR